MKQPYPELAYAIRADCAQKLANLALDALKETGLGLSERTLEKVYETVYEEELIRT